jgi:hypothetical protein
VRLFYLANLIYAVSAKIAKLCDLPSATAPTTEFGLYCRKHKNMPLQVKKSPATLAFLTIFLEI